MTTPRILEEAELTGLDIITEGPPDLRRDIHQFVRYVQTKGLVRTVRGNGIPKQSARALARLLSDPTEMERVERDDSMLWSDKVSRIARGLGLVSFDVEGSYRGYSSYEMSFPDNVVEVVSAAWVNWLGRSPIEKEAAILNHCALVFPNEFFSGAFFMAGPRFSTHGSGVGVANAMNLPRIRRDLFRFLVDLEPGAWFDIDSLVTTLQTRHPHLILDPTTRPLTSESARALAAWKNRQSPRSGRASQDKTPPPARQVEDLYHNFVESDPQKSAFGYQKPQQLTEATAEVFQRVEGRYLQYFLEEIPFMLGLVDLAYRSEDDPRGLDVLPHLGRLRAVRVRPKLRQLMARDPAFNKVSVTVLPDFQVMVEAPSYPDEMLDRMSAFARVEKEEAPIWFLRISRDLVVQTATQADAPQAEQVFRQYSGASLPSNVASELASWTRRGEKLVIYRDFSLVEIRDKKRCTEISKVLGSMVAAETPDGFLLASPPGETYDKLVQSWQVPRRVVHPASDISALKEEKPRAEAPKRKPKVRCETEAAILFQASDPTFTQALLEAAIPGLATYGTGLVLPASSLPRLQEVMASLGESFDIEESRAKPSVGGPDSAGEKGEASKRHRKPHAAQSLSSR